MNIEENTKSLKAVNNYILESSPFAQGDKSKIYKAWKNDSPNTFYAAKCIDAVEFEKMIDLISNEIAFAKFYKSTGCIIEYQDTKKSKNNYYNFYSYFDSYTLDEMISDISKELDYNRKLEIAKNIISTISLIHQSCIMHRNLNPMHILISKTSNKILLCGAKSMHCFHEGKYPYDKIGSYPYQAPEISSSSKDKPYNEKVDIFSFGIILYKLFIRNINDIFIKNLDLDHSQEVSPRIKELIKNCLNIDPEKRLNSQEIIKKNYFEPFITEYINPFCLNTRETLFPYEEINPRLGSGSYGIVSLVKNAQNGKMYAKKAIKKECMNSKKTRELVTGEMKLFNSLRDVGFVINLVEAFYYHNKLNMILEYCNGGSLERKIQKRLGEGKHLNLEEIRLIAWNLAEGLNELHKRSIVHRDLKPDNILLIVNEDGVILDVKICDLGLGKQLQESRPEFTTVCGTQTYMAPELRFQHHYNSKFTNKVDVYSYGLILLAMIFDRKQLESIVKNLLSNHKIQFPSIPQYIPIELIELIKQCIVYEPKMRTSFANIILNPFFNQITTIPILSHEICFKKKDPEYETNYWEGMKDVGETLWIKLYKEKAIKNINFLKSIKQEINFLTKSQSIPHIVTLKTFGMTDNQIAIVFDFYNGGNLEKLYEFRKEQGTKFTNDEIKCVAKSLIEFIDQMHGKNFLHRRINPYHILCITDENSLIKGAKISGFRYAQLEYLEDKSEKPNIINENRILFVDPKAKKEGFTEESDIWSIGLIIYFMIFGSLPSKDLSMLLKIREEGNLYLPSEIDSGIKNFISFCIRKRQQGELSNKLLKEELLKEKILIF